MLSLWFPSAKDFFFQNRNVFWNIIIIISIRFATTSQTVLYSITISMEMLPTLFHLYRHLYLKPVIHYRRKRINLVRFPSYCIRKKEVLFGQLLCNSSYFIEQTPRKNSSTNTRILTSWWMEPKVTYRTRTYSLNFCIDNRHKVFVL